MLYSVWDQARRMYDYYQTPSQASDTDTPIPKHLPNKFKSAIGHGSDVAWPLPQNAVRVGSGVFAKGSIAMVGGEDLSLGSFDIGSIPYLPFIIVAGVVYWLTR